MYAEMLAAGQYESAAEYDRMLEFARQEYEEEQSYQDFVEETARMEESLKENFPDVYKPRGFQALSINDEVALISRNIYNNPNR